MTVSANAIQATRPSLKHHKCLIALAEEHFSLTHPFYLLKTPVSLSHIRPES